MRSRDNLYPGIDAHLQNMLLMQGDPSPSVWSAFHAENVTNLTNALNDQLPDHYIARTEQSLQIRSVEDELPHPEPLPVHREGLFINTDTPSLLAGRGLGDGVIKVINEFLDKMLPSVVIRRVDDHSLHGEVVTRLELLSPSNKPRGSKYESYLENRVTALQSGTSLIEIDYFHQTPPP